MTFTPNIPTTGQSLGNTRDAIRNNFTNYNDVISVNHYAPNLAEQGKHKFIQMPEVAAPPATLPNEIGLYPKDVGGDARLFLRQENNGTEIQISGADPLIGTSGYTFLPGGITLQWGSEVKNGSTGTLTFPVAFTTVFQVVAAISQSDRKLAVTSVTNANFTFAMENPANNNTVRFIAVGIV